MHPEVKRILDRAEVYARQWLEDGSPRALQSFKLAFVDISDLGQRLFLRPEIDVYPSVWRMISTLTQSGYNPMAMLPTLDEFSTHQRNKRAVAALEYRDISDVADADLDFI